MLSALYLEVRQVLATAARGPRTLERDWACSLVPLAMLGSNKLWLEAFLLSLQTPPLRTAVGCGPAMFISEQAFYLRHVPTRTWQGFVLSGACSHQQQLHTAEDSKACPKQSHILPVGSPSFLPLNTPTSSTLFVHVLMPEPRL